MAGRRSLPEEDLQPVFIATSLGTHFAVGARPTDTIADLKRMIFLEHLSSFPRFGEMRIDAVKVKRRGHFYHLQDSIPLRPIFQGKDYWYISVDASTSAVSLDEIVLHDDPSSDKSPAIENEGLNSGGGPAGMEPAVVDDSNDAGSPGAASGSRKKLKLDETSKHHNQEDLVLHVRPGGRGSIPDSLASGSLENGSSLDKRKNSTNKRDSSRKRTAVPTEEQEPKHVSGAVSVVKHNEPDNKEDIIDTVNMAVVCEQGAVANSDFRGGTEHGSELVLEELNGQVNEKGVSVSAVSVDDTGKNAYAKKRKKSTMRKEQSKKKNTSADQENLQKHVDDLEVNEKSGNAIQVDEEALKTVADDVQNDPVQEENTGEFIGYESTGGATGVASHDPFFIGVMEDKSSAKNRKKSSRTKDSSKKKPLDPDEKHVQTQDPVDKHGPKQIEVPDSVSSLPEPGEQDNTGKTIDEKLDDIKSVHYQMLGADADYGGEVLNSAAFSLQEENNRQIPGDGAISGTEEVHVANELLASVTMVDEFSKEKTKKVTDKPSRKKTAYPEENLGQKQDAKEKILLMHVEESVGANSSAETNEANNKEKSIKEKPAGVVVVHKETLGHNTGDGVLEEDNELLHGGEANDEARRVNLAPDSLASGGMEDVLSKKKKKKSTTKSSKKKIDHTDEKLALEQDPKEKDVPMRVEDPTSIHEQSFDVDANDREQEENNDQFHGDEANGEAEKVSLALDLLASCVMEDESSKKKIEKSMNKQNKKKAPHLEKLALKQDPKEKVAPKHVKDSVGDNTLAETKEADNEQKIKEDSANVVAAHEQNFDADDCDRVQEDNNEGFDRDEANGEAGKVNLALDLLASCVMEEESSKKAKKATNKQNKKKTLQLEEKLSWKQDPKENVGRNQVEDSVDANTSAETKEAYNREKIKENSADVVVVHEQTLDADAGDQVLEEKNEQFYGDEAAVEVERVDLAPVVAVSSLVRDVFSPKKKKPTRTKNATPKKPIDICKDRDLGNVESSLGGSSLARPGELANSKNTSSVVKRNESVTPVRTDVVSQETCKREGMTGTAPETQRRGKRKQAASNRSVEQESDVSAFSEMSKKQMPKFISASTVFKSDHQLSSASPIRASDGKHEDCGSINSNDYFTPSRRQVVVALSNDQVAGLKANVKLTPPNIRKNRASDESASAVEVIKNNKKRHSNLDRYCVAFRNSSNQSLQKRSLLDKSGSIFKDESSGSSDNDRGSGMSDATTRTPYDDTSSSDYSVGDSNALKKSQESGNRSRQNGRPSNMKNLLSTSGKDVELTKILRRSSRYKMAKKAVSLSQEKDMDSEPVNFVLDSQADV